ncbi:TPA: cupin domain-containing protein [candidate division WOR-3 bacterium]|uniref:Cupin domain-containing protein n=1 Tax=candidate division WOR-3 bacterium TaxID=2052148 RepID=A0A350H9I5_UNCW3|nr:cupin domain-containing protein [candidate division WOR-3 bacterium]
MIIKKISDVEKTKMDDSLSKGVTRQILIGENDGSNDIIMRLFTVATKGNSAHHTHNYEHLVYVEKGRGIAVYESGEKEIKAGDIVFVKPNEIHQFKNPFDEEFQFICVIPNKV